MDIFDKYGGKEISTTPNKTGEVDILDKYSKGVVTPAVEPVQMIGNRPFDPAEVNAPTSDLSFNKPLNKLAKSASELPGDIAQSTVTAFKSARDTASQGFEQITKNQPASGVGNMALGVLGMAVSPITGAAKELITKPVTKLTGSEEIGEKAEFLATAGLPVGKTGKVINAMRPSNKAVEKIVEAIGQENLPDVIKQLKSNDRLSVMDVSLPVKMDAQTLIVTEGKHQDKFDKFVKERTAGAKDTVEGAYDDVMGAPVNVVKKLDDMKQKARDTGKKAIEPVVEKTGPADITSIVKHIDDTISADPIGAATLKALKKGETPSLQPSAKQERLFELRQQLRGDWADRDNMFLDVKGEQGLHNIQKALRVEAQTLLDSATGSDRLLGQKLMDMRNRIVTTIDKTAGNIDPKTGIGDYKRGLGAYADDMAVQEAFQKGQNVFRNRPTHVDDRPEAWEQWISKAKDAELEAVKEGARVAVDNQIRGMRFAAKKGTDIPEVEFNAEKLAMLFGKRETDALFEKLRHEKTIADTNTKLLQGSQTAMRNRSNTRVSLPADKPTSAGALLAPVAELAVQSATGVPGASGLVLGTMLGKATVHKGKTVLAKKTNEEYTDLVTATGNARDELIKALESRITKPKLSIGQKVKLALPTSGP